MRTNRRQFLQMSTAAAGLGRPVPGAGRPNIIFFMVDQLAAKWLWGEAGRAIDAPNLTALRERGVAFTSAISSNPICCPARATLATGLTTRGHGVLQNGYELDPAIPTFMQLLQRAGWATGAFGKVHFHAHFHGTDPDYRPYGFDVVHNTEDSRTGEWLDWVEREYPRYYEAALAAIRAVEVPQLGSYGPRHVDLRVKILEIQSRFNYKNAKFPFDTRGRFTLPYPSAVSQTEWITSHAERFIEGTDPAKPVYTHISYVQPHSPSCPPGEYLGRVDASKLPEPAGIEWLNDPLRPVCFPESEGARVAIPKEWRVTRQYYMADVLHLDAQLGRVTEALRKSGRLENTYIVFLSDHGDLLHDHGFTGKGERHYDAGIRVPLMIAGPGLRRGETREEFVQLEDIFPTVLEMAGLRAPAPAYMGPYIKVPEGAEAMPGRSLLGLCRGETPSPWRDAAYLESYNNIQSTTTAYWARTIRTRDWRYTLYPSGQGEQLFSMRDDPDEQRNLAGDAAHAPVRREMRDRLLEQIILQDYPHTPRNRFALGVH